MIQALIDKYEFWIFDLDDTIYPELHYLNNAYKIISIKIGTKYNYSSNECFEFLTSDFKNNGRSNLFDRFIDKYSLPEFEIESFLEILRTQVLKEKIKLFPRSKLLLNKLIYHHKKLFIVTNGNPEQQRNKLKNITFSKYIEYFNVICANEIESKPSPLSFLHLKQNYHLIEELTIMVGDSIYDRQFALNSGISFLDINELVL